MTSRPTAARSVRPSATFAATALDSHAHLWEPSRFRYAWLDDEPRLNRSFVVADRAAAAPTGRGVVVVEANRSAEQALAETAWVAELAARRTDVRIRGFVAHAAVERGAEIAAVLEELAALPLVVGIRRLLQDESPALVTSLLLAQGVRLVGGVGLPFDACVRAVQLPALLRLAEGAGDTTIVLDHLGKPAVTQAPAEAWCVDVAALAALPNVVVKLSGLATEGADGGYHREHVLAHLRFALDVFGPERCLFGSDWPVSSTAVSYGGWLDLVLEAMDDLDDESVSRVLAGNAERVYRLGALA
jgi:L-fuconolactonase